MRDLVVILLSVLLGCIASSEGVQYDYTAYSECSSNPEPALYNGGLLANAPTTSYKTVTGLSSPAFVLHSLTATTRYTFSSWVKVKGSDSVSLKARLTWDNSTSICIGTALASSGCWAFIKGGFVLDSPAQTAILYFQTSDGNVTQISVQQASLQAFSVDEWSSQQQSSILQKRKRYVTVHVSDAQGDPVDGATVTAKQISRGFPFGSAIASTILGNQPYQAWFVERFNAAVFENELKWYTTEPQQGKLNYTLADAMLQFTKANQILVRGHTIFWESPSGNPSWVQNLTAPALKAAVDSRIQSIMTRYKGEIRQWDVSNELLHYDFYEQKLGPNASDSFFQTAQRIDPLSTLFMNDFSVIETCEDSISTVDSYIRRLKELAEIGVVMDGIGLEGHFSKPNIPLMRGVLDKLTTRKLPIWLSEVDISKTFDQQTQAAYLEEVLREGFSHPGVNGVMLWTAFHPSGCYQMCLTDGNFQNLPAGDVVDKLLKEWQTNQVGGTTNGIFSFSAFLGEYEVTVNDGQKTTKATLSLNAGDETMQFNIQV